MKRIIETSNAPGAIGPYSQATEASGMIFVSGQLPIDPATSEFAGDDIKSQTTQSLKNVKAILEEAGCGMNNVLKATIYLSEISNFAGMNEVYNEFFEAPYPARAAFAVKDLPKAALVEIEVVAYKG